MSLRKTYSIACALVAWAACAADKPAAPATNSAVTRTYRLGFSGFPPTPDISRAASVIAIWLPRADAAIIHLEPKWTELLSGESPTAIAHREFAGLVNLYRSRNLDIVVVIDATNGVDRTAQAAELVAAGRSITEPSVQALYRAWARAVVAEVHPVALGLAAETNLIRFGAPARVYQAVVQMANDAARDVRLEDPTLPLFVSVQVDLAWGRLQGTNQYVGVEQDFRDFPFTQWIGLSSYPFLAGFTDPAQMPDDWYRKPLNGRAIPVVITEGGWSSANTSAVTSSPARQAHWIARQMQLADQVGANYVFQLLFADIDLVAFQAQFDPRVLPFARIGMVDSVLAPKPALAVWDSTFARARTR
ncbi:MAG: hypothetical protein ABJB74_05820 [Gemmatimonas sp.]